MLACSSHVEQGDIVAVSVAMEHLDANHDWVVGVTRGTVLLSEHGMARKFDFCILILYVYEFLPS